MSNINPRKELIGEQYGLWEVLNEAPDRGNRIYFTCRCSSCGVVRSVQKQALIGGKSRGCVKCINGSRNKKLTGEKSPSWKGGRHVDSNGYVAIYQPHHPKAKKNGYVKEHTIVMEKKIDRGLKENESVHHINGDRSDNRPENLELWSTFQPYGQRVEDKISWAIEILKMYAPEKLNQF